MNQDDIDYFQPLPDLNKVHQYRQTIKNIDFKEIKHPEYINEVNPEPLITKEMVKLNSENFKYNTPVFNLEDMIKAVEGPFYTIPNGLTAEEIVKLLIED